MDFKRVISALLGLPLVIIIVAFGNNYVIDIFFSIIAIISLKEYFNACSKKAKPIRWVGYVSALFISFVSIINIDKIYEYIVISIPVVVSLLFLHVILTNMKFDIEDIALTFLGVYYIPLFIMFLALIVKYDPSKILIWYALITAWGTDVFAYLIGRTFKLGKHKFSKISPNKSIEGCIAGVVGAIVLALTYTYICNTYFILSINYIHVLIITVILSIVSQVGDFAASSIKRYVDIKDYSDLIPGHGGMLDRIDSVIFLAPFAYILLMFINI